MTGEIDIMLFGQLAQLAGRDRLMLSGIRDTVQLRQEVNTLFPALRQIDYAIAVEKKIVHENAALKSGYAVALLPPFSGG